VLTAASRTSDFASRIPTYRDRVERAMERWLPPGDVHPTRLHAAIRYSVLEGGKRIRPLLAYATGELLGLQPEQVDPIAVAIELVHAYSLVHDDLPAMDDDDLRRGRPTTHVAFDEATAILVGDALQAHAYLVLTTDPAFAGAPEVSCRLVIDLAEASGSEGMAGGQAMDMAAEGRAVSAAELEDLYARKTGCLIRAAVVMPCRARANFPAEDFAAIDRFARAIGVAFQVADDLLDVEGATEVIGKTQGSDIKNNKSTYPSLFGLDAARERADRLYRESMAELDRFGEAAQPLRWLCDYIIRRDR
jgi:geranylgeranyl pyrophosphate synthase